FFRYPLDHLFHSDHFTVIDIQRQEFFGSDHFPIYVELNLEPEARKEQEAPVRKAGDSKEAQEILERR
nr:endonuclease [Bacteroidota bacterium]